MELLRVARFDLALDAISARWECLSLAYSHLLTGYNYLLWPPGRPPSQNNILWHFGT